MLKKLLFVLTDNEKKWLVGLTFGSAILAISETVSIGLIIPIIGLFMSYGKMQAVSAVIRLQNMIGVHDRVAFLTVLISVTMTIFLFKSVYSIFMLRLQYKFTSGIYCRLTGKVMASYLYSPYSFHLDNNSSVLFKNMITEVGQLTSGFLSPAIIVGTEAMVFLAILVLLVCVYPLMTLALAAIFLGMILLLNILIRRKVKNYSEERERHSESIYVTANEALSGVKEIQVNGVQDYFIGRFSQATTRYQSSFIKFNVLSNLPRYILETIFFFAMLTILLINLHLRKSPSELVPMMTVMGAASIKLLPSINKIYLNFNSLHYYANSLDIVYSILKDSCSSADKVFDAGKEAKPVKTGTSAFRMENVRFSYKESGPVVLDSMNIDIPFSLTTAIVGASGAGKSTLIDIFTGLLVPSAGSLYYGDMVVNAENVSSIRKNIGYVPQQIFLTDDTIGANITFGKTEDQIDRGLVDKAMKMANLELFIKSLPKGIDTLVGERGIRLSGGQRQRIGIARALYRNPEILILDEAMSALDGNSEAEIIGVIKKMKNAGMAVVIVAHRLSTISNADLIYVMDHGRIAVRGSFKDLHDNSDIFNSIVHKKAGLKDGAVYNKPEEETAR